MQRRGFSSNQWEEEAFNLKHWWLLSFELKLAPAVTATAKMYAIIVAIFYLVWKIEGINHLLWIWILPLLDERFWIFEVKTIHFLSANLLSAILLTKSCIKCTIRLLCHDPFLTFLSEPRPVAGTTLSNALHLRWATAGLDEDLGK